MVAVVVARDGRRLALWGPGLHPLCGPCTCWVRRNGWCINCVEHWHSPALIPIDARGPSTKLIYHLVVALLPEKRGFSACAAGVFRHGIVSWQMSNVEIAQNQVAGGCNFCRSIY